MNAPENVLDELLTPQRWETGRCTIVQALDRIADGETRARVAAACPDGSGVSGDNLFHAFKHLLGYAPSPASIKRHRNGTCLCG